MNTRLLCAVVLVAGGVLIGGYTSLSASPIRQLTATQAANLRPSLSPDGKRIAFQSNRDGPYHIYVMDADGANARRVTSGDSDDRHPSWSPDGKFLAIDSGDQTKREIWLIDVATGTRTQITKLGMIASFPSWSPDGRRLAFFTYQAGVMDLWTVGRDGSALGALTKTLASETNQQCTFACHAPAWSPDGGRLALADGDGSRIVLMSSLVAGAQTPISPSEERSHFPIYTKDGQIIYVTEHVSQDQSWTDLWLTDPQKSDQRTEVAQGVQVQGPFEISADGTQLLFHSPRSGNFEIYSVTLDEAGKAALAEKPQHTAFVPPGPVQTQFIAPEESFAQRAAPFVVGVGLLALAAIAIASRRQKRRA